MFEYKIFLGYLAVLIALASYVPYFKNIFLGKTKPHAFSWFIWSVLQMIAFAAQVVKHGGAGTWVTGFTGIVCFIVSVIAYFKGDRKFSLFDWSCLTAALFGIVLWYLTKDPLLAVLVATAVDAVGYIPTFRKGYFKPYEETLSTYVLSFFKSIIAIFALQSLSVTTWLFPASLVISNGLFVILLWVRRKIK